MKKKNVRRIDLISIKILAILECMIIITYYCDSNNNKNNDKIIDHDKEC